MPRKKEIENPNHHMGKQTGYELIDGAYHIAPLYKERMSLLTFQKQGIDEMLASVTQHASKDFERIASENHTLWKDIADDIGLDQTVTWQYTNGVVHKGRKEIKRRKL